MAAPTAHAGNGPAAVENPGPTPSSYAPPEQEPSSAQEDPPRKKQQRSSLDGAADSVAAAPADTVGFLQELIDAELGPPKFAVSKPQQAAADGKATHKRTPPSLEALLDQEFGPPRFAVPKAASPLQHEHAPAAPAAAAAPEDVVLLEQQPHLRLEVLSGPAAGSVYDTADLSQEVRGEAAPGLPTRTLVLAVLAHLRVLARGNTVAPTTTALSSGDRTAHARSSSRRG